MSSDPILATVLPTAPQGAPPVSVGSLVSRTFSTWWKQQWRLALTTVVMVAPVFLAYGGFIAFWAWSGRFRPGMDEGSTMVVGIAGIVFMVVVWLALLVQACSHAHGVIEHLSGRRVRMGTMLAVGLGRFLPLLVLYVLGFLVAVGIAYGLEFLTNRLEKLLGEGIAVLVLLVVLVPTFSVLATALCLTLPALVVERAGPFNALKRSWQLSRGRRGAIFLALVVVFLVLLAIFLAEAWAFKIVVLDFQLRRFQGGGPGPTVRMLAALIPWILMLVWALASSLLSVVPAVAYNDVRIEKEGTPTDELAQVFG
jgi:hypothetical protein